MKHLPSITILGGGNGAFATAADLALRGFSVRLCELPEFKENIEGAQRREGIELTVIGNPGLKSGFGKLEMITTDFQKALEGADIIFVVVPAFGQSRFAKASASCLKSDQLVVLSPGNFGGSLEFAHVIKESGVETLPLLCDFECMIYSGFKNSDFSVEVSGYKHGIMMAAYPGSRSNEAYERLKVIYPEILPAENILEIGLSNINTVLHAPITVLNAGRIEDPLSKFLFYWQGATFSVTRVIESVDREKMALGKRLGIKLFSLSEILIRFYSHLGLKGATLHEMVSTNPVYEIDWAPEDLKHRFLLEDIPFGMVPMETLGKLIGVPTPATTSIINLASILLDIDLRENARDLEKLGLNNLSADEIKHLVTYGNNYQNRGKS
jgi:opine dehydrogenase